MLTPDELEKLQEHLDPLYQELEDFMGSPASAFLGSLDNQQ